MGREVTAARLWSGGWVALAGAAGLSLLGLLEAVDLIGALRTLWLLAVFGGIAALVASLVLRS